MHFVTLRVIKRTRSVRNGMPTRSIGTIVMVLPLTTIVPQAPAWERIS
ncbi:hypothetical protein ALP23_04453 [Pseudomonas syringae pv. apii]|uniref:Uncharacterized protein n=1 Tax=Pseudomonas syringae pv. apii TaxID=81036 RepID=A0A3M5WKZ0_9PSED|nr:hypothetical protein ALP23_04453 [Pseudomonas syringae pv. apii]